MKKFILGILLSAFCLTSFATPVFLPHVFDIENTGNVPLYYALNKTGFEYSSVLCVTMDGQSLKEKVIGEILPSKTKRMILQAVSNYPDLCSQPWLDYDIGFGLTQDGASYGENSNIFVLMEFNAYPSYGQKEPFLWEIRSGTSSSLDVITEGTQPDGTLVFYVNSNSKYLVY